MGSPRPCLKRHPPLPSHVASSDALLPWGGLGGKVEGAVLSHRVRPTGGVSAGPLKNEPKVIELQKSDTLSSGYVGVREELSNTKRKFSVHHSTQNGDQLVTGRFATAEEAALRRHNALKVLA